MPLHLISMMLPVIHLLEPRRFLSVTVDDGVLTVTGTKASARISIFTIADLAGNYTEVRFSGRYFDLSPKLGTFKQPTRTVVQSRGGNDDIRFFAELSSAIIPISIHAGNGHDRVSVKGVRA